MQEIVRLILPLLHENELCIADVGSQDKPPMRWKEWEKGCFFYTFLGRPPYELASSVSSHHFAVGLWSHKCIQMLHVAAQPSATSLFKPNQVMLNAFPSSAHEEVGKRAIELNRLDSILAGLPLDYLKIDGEGAELEILKGAQSVLTHQCLGLQLEALFCPIRHNVPSFSDVDLFLRNFDFQLFQLHREHWLRKNRVATFASAPQLISGSSVYLLSKKTFLKRLKECPQPEKLFAKYLAIVLAYRLYDYAYELCEEVDLPVSSVLQKSLLSLSAPKMELIRLLLSLLNGAGKYTLSFSTLQKQRHRSYLVRKIRQLGQACLYFGRNDFAFYD